MTDVTTHGLTVEEISRPMAPAKWIEPEVTEAAIGKRFAADTANHQLTVLHDDRLYRHLRFAQPKPASSMYWFDLITWPGGLMVRGDIGDAYVFNRLPDMFEFFRGKGINPHYWSQKLDAGRDSAKVYSPALFRQLVVEHFVDAVRYSDAPRGLGMAIRAEILDQDLGDETEARALLEGFEFQGFTFDDVWEWNFHDYDWSFLWACHAIVAGIAQYDVHRAAVLAGAPAEQRTAELRALLPADRKPATDGLMASLVEAVRDIAAHQQTDPKAENLFAGNLHGWMGERMAPVLVRLLDTETRNARLTAERDAAVAALDALAGDLAKLNGEPVIA